MQHSAGKWSGRKFRFNWGMSLFTVALLPVLISFGFWQLDREQQKTLLQSQYNGRILSTPNDVEELDWNTPDLGWTPVVATGYFDSERQFLLDNRIFESKVGYEVITPFITENGIILVNRGWVSQGLSRAEVPDIAIDGGTTTITGHIYVPDGETLVLASDEPSDGRWPKLIQKIDVVQLAANLGTSDVKPFVVRLKETSAGVLQTNWAAINMRPETHRAYAVQWFTMATVLLILYIMFSFRLPEN